MKDFHPIAAGEKTAAKLLDMKPAEFRRLVDAGALPSPITIGNNIERWIVSDLRAILSGEATRPQQDFEL